MLDDNVDSPVSSLWSSPISEVVAWSRCIHQVGEIIHLQHHEPGPCWKRNVRQTIRISWFLECKCEYSLKEYFSILLSTVIPPPSGHRFDVDEIEDRRLDMYRRQRQCMSIRYKIKRNGAMGRVVQEVELGREECDSICSFTGFTTEEINISYLSSGWWIQCGYLWYVRCTGIRGFLMRNAECYHFYRQCYGCINWRLV